MGASINALSKMAAFSPMTMASVSALRTAKGQTLAFLFRVTSPMSLLDGSTNTPSSHCGNFPLKGMRLDCLLPFPITFLPHVRDLA